MPERNATLTNSDPSSDPLGRTRFSLRTYLLAMAAVAILCAVLFTGPMRQVTAHFLIVVAFALPGGSLAWDMRRTSRAVAIGASLAAVAGCLLLSALVLLADLLVLFGS